MKKVLTMIAAVAMAFGLYADDATLNEAFEAKNLPAGPFTPTAPGWAEYTGADGTLNITGEEGERVLDIATGSAALTRYAAENGAEFQIDEENNLFLDMTVDFKAQVLDEVPTNNIAATDKIGLFVLDTSDIEGAPAMTNLFAIAGYGAAGKALYDLGEVNAKWFDDAKRITIKAYDNVFQSGTRTGFLVSVVDAGEAVLPKFVQAVYPIVNGAVNWKDASTSTDYLGGVALISKVAQWAKPGDPLTRNLLFSMADGDSLNGSLTSIDFRGNAQIANVGFTETNPGFADDAVTMTVDRDSDVTFVVKSPAEGVTYDGTTTLTSEGYEGNVTITVTAAKPIVEVDVNGTAATKAGDDWTFTFTKDATLNVKDYAAAAYVGTTPFKSLFDDEETGYVGAISHVNQNGGTLKLAQNVTALEETEAFAFSGEKDIILDLAGKTLTVYDGAKLSNVGKLTIMDSLTGGNIVGDVDNYNALVISNGVFNGELLNSWDDGLNGVTTIYDGTFEGAVVNDPVGADDETAVKITAVGGKFDAEANDKDDVEGFLPLPGEKTYEVVGDKEEDPDYWVVQEKVIQKGTVIFICEKNDVEFKRVPVEGDVGTTIEKKDFPTFDLDTDIWTLTWDQDSVTIAEGSQDVTADAAIEFVGEGTEANPFQIASFLDLKKLDAYVQDGLSAGKFFEQTQTIDLNNEVWTGIGEKYEYNSVGNVEALSQCVAVFRGVYNGGGFEIQNACIVKNESDNSYSGIFNTTASATISNLVVRNMSFPYGKNGVALIGDAFDGTVVDNVKFEGTMGTTDSPITANAGGIFVAAKGIEAANAPIFKNCVNNGTLYGKFCDKGGKHLKLGGIGGFTQGTVKIEDCVNNGTIQLDAAYQDAAGCGIAGILGGVSTGSCSFKNCVNNGLVKNDVAQEDPLDTGHFAMKIGDLIGYLGSQATAAGTVNLGGCVCAADKPVIGGFEGSTSYAKSTVGFDYATIAANKATYQAALAEGDTATVYALMHAGLTPTFTLTAAGKEIAFDESKFAAEAFAITADDESLDVSSAKVEDVTTFTAVTKTFTVKFWNDTDLFAESNNIPWGATTAAPAPAPTKSGAEFKFWATIDENVTNVFVFTTQIEKDYDLYAIFEASAPVPVPVDDKIVYTGITAANADAACEKVTIQVPSDIATQIPTLDQATYEGYFKKSAVETSTGVFTVTAELDPEKIDYEASVESLAGQLTDAESKTSATIAAKPGLYYSVDEANALADGLVENENDRVLAKGATVTVPKTYWTDAGFYKLRVSTTAQKPEKGN